MMERPGFSERYQQELMPLDVIRQDMGVIANSTESTLEFHEPPMEIADYLSHYFHMA
jgi:hypothetical protein